MRLPRLLERRDGEPRALAFLRELHAFAWHQAWACLFAVAIFLALGATKWLDGAIPRYDLLLAICLLTQWAMLRGGIETRDELKVICVFHFLGLAMELHKVRVGSWSYPEQAWTKIGGVPLYSGFMYASVASYMCQSWRRLDLRMERWPPAWQTALLGAAIYLNFFTNRWLPDARLLLFAAMVAVFARTSVAYVNNGPVRRMPMILAFLLIAFFIWLAENIGTFLNAWQYPHQRSGWRAVHLQKLSSWFLLVIVSLILVAHLKRLKERIAPAAA